MIEEITVGMRFGDLTVLAIEVAGKIHCECSCGAELRTIARELVQGDRTRCKNCDLQLSQGGDRTVDLFHLQGLRYELKVRILRGYTEHVRACRTFGTLPASFATYVREFQEDPDAEKDEMPLTFEERLALSNPQRYPVYDRPRELL